MAAADERKIIMIGYLQRRFIAAGRYGKRGIIYALISTVGFVVEVMRFGLQRPFALIMWTILFAVGAMLFFIMTDSLKKGADS